MVESFYWEKLGRWKLSDRSILELERAGITHRYNGDVFAWQGKSRGWIFNSTLPLFVVVAYDSTFFDSWEEYLAIQKDSKENKTRKNTLEKRIKPRVDLVYSDDSFLFRISTSNDAYEKNVILRDFREMLKRTKIDEKNFFSSIDKIEDDRRGTRQYIRGLVSLLNKPDESEKSKESSEGKKTFSET